MASVRITLLGLYGLYKSMDKDLFDLLVLPAKIERETFLNTLFLDYGERGILYTNPDVFHDMIGTWSAKWQIELERIAQTLTDDYEPLWNIDRYEDVTDQGNENESGTVNANASGTNGQTIENTVSAFNSSNYEPKDKTTVNGSTSDTLSQSSGNEKTNELNHTGHYYGNGGVTSSQSLAIEEIKLREKYNMYHEACKLFAEDLLLYTD